MRIHASSQDKTSESAPRRHAGQDKQQQRGAARSTPGFLCSLSGIDLLPPDSPANPPDAPVQFFGGARGGGGASFIRHAARLALDSGATRLPYFSRIQHAFGRHDLSSVHAHTDATAAFGSQLMGAQAFTRGDHVAFAETPSLRTAAHEAAHVVQQRSGASVPSGVGKAGDRWEQHADLVADRVVAGQSASDLLDPLSGSGPTTSRAPDSAPVQRAIYIKNKRINWEAFRHHFAENGYRRNQITEFLFSEASKDRIFYSWEAIKHYVDTWLNGKPPKPSFTPKLKHHAKSQVQNQNGNLDLSALEARLQQLRQPIQNPVQSQNQDQHQDQLSDEELQARLQQLSQPLQNQNQNQNQDQSNLDASPELDPAFQAYLERLGFSPNNQSEANASANQPIDPFSIGMSMAPQIQVPKKQQQQQQDSQESLEQRLAALMGISAEQLRASYPQLQEGQLSEDAEIAVLELRLMDLDPEAYDEYRGALAAQALTHSADSELVEMATLRLRLLDLANFQEDQKLQALEQQANQDQNQNQNQDLDDNDEMALLDLQVFELNPELHASHQAEVQELLEQQNQDANDISMEDLQSRFRALLEQAELVDKNEQQQQVPDSVEASDEELHERFMALLEHAGIAEVYLARQNDAQNQSAQNQSPYARMTDEQLLKKMLHDESFQDVIDEFNPSVLTRLGKALTSSQTYTKLLPGVGIYKGIKSVIKEHNKSAAAKQLMENAPHGAFRSASHSTMKHAKIKRNVAIGKTVLSTATTALSLADMGVSSAVTPALTSLGTAAATSIGMGSSAASTATASGITRGTTQYLTNRANPNDTNFGKQKIKGKKNFQNRGALIEDYRNNRAFLYQLGQGALSEEEMDIQGISQDSEQARLEMKSHFGSPADQDLTLRQQRIIPVSVFADKKDWLTAEERAVYTQLQNKEIDYADVPPEMILPILWHMNKLFDFHAERMAIQQKEIEKQEKKEQQLEEKQRKKQQKLQKQKQKQKQKPLFQ